jgi:hypothetical protein
VPVYFQAAEDTVFGADLAYSLGINNCYFDQIDTSQGASQYFYPFTIWDYAYFFSFRQDWRTDDEGCTWDNYSFVGSSNDPNPPFNNYWLTLIPGAPPVHGLTFRIHASDYVAPANHFSCNAIGPGDSGI